MQYRASLTVAALAATLTLSGCLTASPNDPAGSNQQQGILGGALLGGLFGAAVDDDNRGRGAVIGALGGAVAGGALGAELDRQAEELRQAMASDDVIVTSDGEVLRVILPEGVLFDFDSAAVRAEFQGDIRAVAQSLNTYPNSTVDVVGHTDDTGSAQYNMDLSNRRAAAVGGILLEAGVAPARVRTFGRGELEPIASNDTAEGRAQNRRVEILIRPSAV